MTAGSETISTQQPKSYRAILWGGLIAGTLDITAAFTHSAVLGRGPILLLQGIASGLLGADSYNKGFASAALGLSIHFLIAFVATTVYYLASRIFKFMTERAIICGLLYGIAVYFFMYRVVLALTFPRRPSDKLSAILIGLTIHMLCVGLPIALVVRRHSANPATA